MTLVAILFAAVVNGAVAGVLTAKNLKGYFRLLIRSDKSDLKIAHLKNGLVIKTLNRELFNSLLKELGQVTVNNRYIQSLGANQEQGEIKLLFKNSDIVFFNFYRDRAHSNIIDIWSENPNTPVVAKAKEKKRVNIKTNKTSVKQGVRSNIHQNKTIKKVKVAQKKQTKLNTKVTLFKNAKEYRDFRYGAPFIWDYKPLAPAMKRVIKLDRKTAEYFYPVVDRNYEKNDKEAHLQLIINLYRKKKWGLMYKAMKLFARKYGEGTESDFIEYLKANALLKDNLLGKQDPKRFKTVISMYEALAEKTTNYELKKSLIKFLIQYHLEDKNYIATLSLAKRLYVIVQKNFDIEENPYAVDVILISLAKLHQIKKIEKLVNDKTVIKIVPKLRLASFKIYALMEMNQLDKALSYYQQIAPSLTTAATASILFNVAEGYFRQARYKQAIKLYDRFIHYYSANAKSSAARLRIALAYDLLEREPKLIAELYKNAIDHAAKDDISIEARLRYVAFRKIRKRVLTEDDHKISYLLNFKDGEEITNNNLKKMLWCVRLRSFIVDGEYLKALSYLNAIPISSLKPSERRTFNGDGAEIVLGLIQKLYRKGNYSKIIRLWEIYKAKYISKVALDPYTNYIVGKAYLNLALYNSFDNFYNSFSKLNHTPKRQFPKWITRVSYVNRETLLDELLIVKNIKLKNWSQVEKELEHFSNQNRRKSYYLGLLHYNQKKYIQAVRDFESYFASSGKEQVESGEDLGKMLDAYMKSILHSGDMKKYEKVGQAVLIDLDKSKKLNPYLLSVKEEIAYMLIENMFSNSQFERLLLNIKKFQADYKNSIYADRIKYLYGVALVRTAQETEGQKVFQEIINDKNVPDYLKELSKTELSLIKIKNKLI